MKKRSCLCCCVQWLTLGCPVRCTFLSPNTGLAAIKSDCFGVVTSCPTNIGTGMRASVHIQLPNLTADGTDAKAKAICKHLGLSVRGLGGEHTPIGADGTVDISPSARFCISEAEIIAALYKGVELLKREEDAEGKVSSHPRIPIKVADTFCEFVSALSMAVAELSRVQC